MNSYPKCLVLSTNENEVGNVDLTVTYTYCAHQGCHTVTKYYKCPVHMDTEGNSRCNYRGCLNRASRSLPGERASACRVHMLAFMI